MKAKIFLKAQKLIIQNAPTILAVLGGTAAIGAVVMAIDGTKKSEKKCKELDEEIKGDLYSDYCQVKELNANGVSNTDICEKMDFDAPTVDTADLWVRDMLAMPKDYNKQKALIYIKSYTPAALLLGGSLLCIFGGNHISKKRIAQLGAAYILSETTFKEYKEKTKELLGKKKAQDIEDDIVQDRVLKNPPTEANTFMPSMSNDKTALSLWYDVISDRYFYSSAEIIRRAEIEAQRMLDKNGFVNLNDVYGILGIKEIPLGNDIGWQKDIHKDVNLVIGAVLNDNQEPVGTLTMEVYPSSAWLSEV